MDDGDGCTIVGVTLMPLSCTLKNGKFYVMYILPQFKEKKLMKFEQVEEESWVRRMQGIKYIFDRMF